MANQENENQRGVTIHVDQIDLRDFTPGQIDEIKVQWPKLWELSSGNPPPGSHVLIQRVIAIKELKKMAFEDVEEAKRILNKPIFFSPEDHIDRKQ